MSSTAAAATNTAGAGAGRSSEGLYLGKFRMSYEDCEPEETTAIVNAATNALQRYVRGALKHFSQVAQSVQAEVTEAYPGTWHVIVGMSYGSMVTHEAKNMVYFFFGQVGFLVFKHG